MLSHIAAALFGGIVVATKDHDGEVRIRHAVYTPFGYRCRGILFARRATLNPDGSVSGPESYISQWKIVWAGWSGGAKPCCDCGQPRDERAANPYDAGVRR